MKKYIDDESNQGDPNLRRAVKEIIDRIGDSLPNYKEPIKMFLAGGMAVNFYTGYRPTRDVDASFSQLILLPQPESLVVAYEDANGKPRHVYFDPNYNTTFAVIHPDHQQDAYPVRGAEFANGKIELYVLSPLDLAVSKIARFQTNDQEDIAELAKRNLITPKALKDRASEALDYYVGSTNMLLHNLNDAVRIVQDNQSRPGPKPEKHHGR